MDNAVFPLDIFTEIVDQLATLDQPPTHSRLRQCSLVCKAFLPLAQKHICQKIMINLIPNVFPKHLQNLTETLQHRPAIASYVKTFSLYTRVRHDSPDSEEMLNDPSFLILLQLPNIQTLKISAVSRISYSRCSTTTWGPRLLIDHYLRRDCLLNVKIGGIDDLPIHLILSPPQLTNLTINSASFAAPDQDLDLLLNKRPHSLIKSLKLYGVKNVPRSSFAHLFSHAEELIVAAVSFAHHSYDTTFQSTDALIFKNLHTLHSYSEFDWSTLLANKPSLRAFPALKTLDLRIMSTESSQNGIVLVDNTTCLEKVDVLQGAGSLLWKWPFFLT
ncbi:hypothetical protein CVT24_001949 [Panaeolus cyanescens]|uniref:F-box domain-containing protein n=1 Tax=Panaeolus cyanescens TaxID=181874 RepID=A0A409YHP0_9AGAR|nr:hypothetical protein CVT24_001949 [Panaeolus cyanescens]